MNDLKVLKELKKIVPVDVWHPDIIINDLRGPRAAVVTYPVTYMYQNIDHGDALILVIDHVNKWLMSKGWAMTQTSSRPNQWIMDDGDHRYRLYDNIIKVVLDENKNGK